MNTNSPATQRAGRFGLEQLIGADMRALNAASGRIGRHFARRNDLSHNDFQALLHIMVADTAAHPLTLTELRQHMDVSAPAITYLVDRMIAAGHIRREADPDDRRKSLLRYSDSGMELAREFFTSLGDHVHGELVGIDDDDLRSAHRVFTAMIAAMSTFDQGLAAPPELDAPID